MPFFCVAFIFSWRASRAANAVSNDSTHARATAPRDEEEAEERVREEEPVFGPFIIWFRLTIASLGRLRRSSIVGWPGSFRAV